VLLLLLEVLIARLFSGSIEDVLGDLLGDDSKSLLLSLGRRGDTVRGSASQGVSLTV
jgi:hypothetical protein